MMGMGFLVPSPRPPDTLKSGVDEGRSCVFFFCGVLRGSTTNYSLIFGHILGDLQC